VSSNTTGIKRVREDEEDVSGEVLEEQQPDFKRFKTDPAFAVATIAGAPSPAVTAVEFARPDPVTPNATFAVPPPVHVSSLAADDAMDVVPSSPSSSASIAVTGPSSETSSQPSQITLTPIASQPSGRFVHTSPGAMAVLALSLLVFILATFLTRPFQPVGCRAGFHASWDCRCLHVTTCSKFLS